MQREKLNYDNVIKEDVAESPVSKMTEEEFVNILSGYFERDPNNLPSTQANNDNVLDDFSNNSNDAVDEERLFEDLEKHLTYEASQLPPWPYRKSCWTPRRRRTPKHLRKKLSDYFRFNENGTIQYICPKITDSYPVDRSPKTLEAPIDRSPKTPEAVVKDLEYSPRFWDSVIRHCSQIENHISNDDHYEVELDDSDSENSEMDMGQSNEDRVIETLTFETIDVTG